MKWAAPRGWQSRAVRSSRGAMPVRSYRDLLVWQRAMDLVDAVYLLCRTLPASERFGLANQMQRAAVSIAANIAEGHGLGITRSYLYHLSIASGSLAELETELLIANRQHFLTEFDLARMLDSAQEVSVMLRALRTSLKRRVPEGPR